MKSLRQRLIEDLAAEIRALASGRPSRVAIDGRTASGKTTFADELATAVEAHGRPAIRAMIDGFHRPRAERYRRGRLSAEGYLDDARDWAAIRRLLLDPLGPGGDRRYRTASFDLDADQPIDQTPRTAPPDAVLIVDGTFLQREELAPAWDYVIFLDVPEDVATARGVARDAESLGGEAAARQAHALRYQAAFALYAARCRPAERAHMTIDHARFDAPTILRRRPAEIRRLAALDS